MYRTTRILFASSGLEFRGGAQQKCKKKYMICIFIALATICVNYLYHANHVLTPKKTQDKETSIPSKATYIDEDGVCVNALPYGKLHNLNKFEVQRYNLFNVERANFNTFYERIDRGPALKRREKKDEIEFTPFYGEKDPPELQTLPPGSSFAHWDCEMRKDDCEYPLNKENIKGSAWTADGEDAFINKMFPDMDRRIIWVPHDNYDFLATKTTTLKGDTAAMFGFHPENFGHVLHDNFPLLAWLKSTLHERTTFALPDTPQYRDLIAFIDPDFLSRIYFYQSNEIITVEEGTLTVAKSKSGKFLSYYGNTLFRHMRHWIFDNHPGVATSSASAAEDNEKYVVFYVRRGPHTAHGRQLDKEQEKDVLAMIRAKMKRYRRDEKLVIFSGMDKDENLLPYREQFEIFRRASTIIGPHGSGLANVVWTNPFPKSCEDRVQVLEFISGSDSVQVQMPVFYGYYWVMRGMPIDWHQITYSWNSTSRTTYIRLDDLDRALDDMWKSKNETKKSDVDR